MEDDKVNTCYDVKLMIKPFNGKNNFNVMAAGDEERPNPTRFG